MRNRAFVAIALAVIGLFICNVVKAGTGDMKIDILQLVNEHRAAKHLPPLEMFDNISDAAEKHSTDMAKKRVPFGHDGFDERVDGLMIKIKGANAAAENVAYGAPTAADVVRMWLNSSGHRKNIEGNFNMTGIGIAQDKDGRLYYTQIFINKK